MGEIKDKFDNTVIRVPLFLRDLLETYKKKYPALLNAPLSHDEWRDLIEIIHELESWKGDIFGE